MKTAELQIIMAYFSKGLCWERASSWGSLCAGELGVRVGKRGGTPFSSLPLQEESKWPCLRGPQCNVFTAATFLLNLWLRETWSPFPPSPRLQCFLESLYQSCLPFSSLLALPFFLFEEHLMPFLSSHSVSLMCCLSEHNIHIITTQRAGD